MKKQLLLSGALLAAISAYPQNYRPAPANAVEVNMADRIAKRFAAESIDPKVDNMPSSQVNQPSLPLTGETGLKPSNTNSFATTWNPFTGSMNVYGVIIGSSTVLNYNEDINAVSFVHRKSDTYQVSPTPSSAGAAAGAIVAMVSQNWGSSWDSTCFYSNDTYWGRYPQGAIYNPSGNTCIDQAYIVGVGPVTPNAGGWVGNFYASKQLGTGNYNNMASTTPSAVQVMLNANMGVNKVDFIRYDFSTTDDGKVRTVGIISKDISGSGAGFGFRGARLMTGSFNSGVFTWSADSIIPNAVIQSDQTKSCYSTPYMAWNESGTVGYIVHIGASANGTLNNVGWQPIIHKTTNSGLSWSPVNGINFNNPNMSPVLDHIYSPVTATNLSVPFFNVSENIAVTVDKNDNLHIATLVVGTARVHPDSLNYTFNFANADGETYSYPHSPGLRPYLYDFVGNGAPASTWSVITVDSLSSEAPGAAATDDGFNTNPWLVGTDGSKPQSDARIQLSRTADGNHVVVTFAESDTAVTSGPGFKWNELPNVKARLISVNGLSVNPVEVNITKPSSGTNPAVSSRAYFHYASRKCAVAQNVAVGPNGPCIALPITVTRNQNLDPMTPVVHRYATAALNFGAVPVANMELPAKAACATETNTGTGFQQNEQNSVNASFLFPNPAQSSVSLYMNLDRQSSVSITVANLVGQQVKTIAVDAAAGESTVNIPVNELAKGVYMVTVKSGTASSTKKLIVE